VAEEVVVVGVVVGVVWAVGWGGVEERVTTMAGKEAMAAMEAVARSQ
jgi:hypothetical protein